jgi:phosphoglycerate dehydrogenase-like enzyme
MHVIATLEHAGFLTERVIPHVAVTSDGYPVEGTRDASGPVAVWWSFSMTAAGRRRVFDRYRDRIVWVHSDAAGVDHLAPLPPRAAVTSAHAAQTRGVAEWVLAAMLWDTKDMAAYQRRSDSGLWQPGGTATGLSGRRAAFFGTGAITQRVLPALLALDVDAVGTNETGTQVHGMTTLPFREWVGWLRTCRWLVIAAPLTDDTEHAIDLGVLSNLDGACLINVGRGRIVAPGAIEEALRQGWLHSAVLDVHDPEPLPATSPLWTDDRVLVLPHDTWRTDGLRHSRQQAFLAEYRRRIADS